MGHRRRHVKSTSGSFCVAASARTLRSVMYRDCVVTTLMADFGRGVRLPGL